MPAGTLTFLPDCCENLQIFNFFIHDILLKFFTLDNCAMCSCNQPPSRCSIDDNNLENMDNLINVIMSNHNESECDDKLAVCHALAVLDPSKLTGSVTKGEE